MKINVISPSQAEAVVKPCTGSILLEVRPNRWDSRQQALTAFPIDVVSESGKLLDSAVLVVNQRTGKLSLSRMSTAPLPCDADAAAGTVVGGA